MLMFYWVCMCILELGIATELRIRYDSNTLGPTLVRFVFLLYNLVLIL